MTNSAKRPPINLSDLSEPEAAPQVTERPRQGSLSYVDRPRKASSSGSSGGMMQQLLIVGVAVGLSTFIMMFFAAKTSDVQTMDANVRTVNERVTALADTIGKSNTEMNSKIDTAIVEARSAKTSLAGYALLSQIPTIPPTPDLSPFALKSQIPAIPPAVNMTPYALKTDLASVVGESISYNVGTDPSGLSLTVKSKTTGTYVARVTLTYDAAPIMNSSNTTYEAAMTSFYGTFISGANRSYIPSLFIGNGSWRLASVSFTTAAFELTAGEPKTYIIAITGLTGYTKAFMEILPGAGTTTSTSNGI